MQESDHSVVQSVLAGNKEAYGALVRAHSTTVFRVAFRITGNEADAEEIVQEAFLRGYQRLGSFQQRSSFRNLDLPDRCELRPEPDQASGHCGKSTGMARKVTRQEKTVQVAAQDADPGAGINC